MGQTSTIHENINLFSLVDNLLLSRRIGFVLSFAVGNGKIKELPLANITHFKANKELSIVHFDAYKRKKINISQSMSYNEKQLKNFGFVRIHRAYIVNLSFLKKVICSKEKCRCLLFDGTELPVSRRRQKAF